ncbi:MAG: helix-turn-helix transcriptional regulator [Frankia sp.]|nr:helix-turn-helix transcriptional regulator [Frankia sp.]
MAQHHGWDPHRLRHAREQAGLTQEQLADALNRVLPTPTASPEAIRRHESGRHHPQARYRHAYRQVLGGTDQELGFRVPGLPARVEQPRRVGHHRGAPPADAGFDRLWSPGGLAAAFEEATATPSSSPLERRQFIALSGVALAAAAHEWLIADPARITASLAGKRADAAVVADLTTTVDALRRLDDKLGGQAVHGMVTEQLRLVVGVLRNASYTETDGRGLYAIAAELARLAGWTSYDAGDHGTAQRYYLVGLRAAAEADAPGIGANILRCMADQARKTGDPHTAVNLLRSARAGARGRLTATEQAVLFAGLARSHGRAHDQYQARHSIDAAYQAIQAANPAEDPPYIYWASPSEIAFAAGASLLYSGQPQAAIPHLPSSVEQISADMPRELLEVRVTLATAHAKAGDPDEAVTIVHKAITATAVPSAIVGVRLTELCRELDTAGHPGAEDLAEHIGTVTRTDNV